MFCLGPFSGVVWYVEKNLTRKSALAHPLGWCGASHGNRDWSALMLVLSHVLRMCSGGCVHVCASMRACVYVYTRTCMSHVIVRKQRHAYIRTGSV